MSDLRTAVIIVNYASTRLIADMQGREMSDESVMTIVVDNWSGQSERRRLAEVCKSLGWVVVGLDANAGFGAGVNAGAREAMRRGATELVILNPDARIDLATLRMLVERVRDDPALMIAPRIETADGKTWFDGAHLLPWRGSIRSGRAPLERWEWLTGACLVMSARAFSRLGGFDPAYFLYWEDVDLSYRWLALGGRLDVMRECTVTHLVGATQQSKGKPPSYVQMNTRNRLWFARRNLKVSMQISWAAMAPIYAVHSIRAASRVAVKQRPLLYLLAALRGTVQGVFGSMLVPAGAANAAHSADGTKL